MKVPFILFTTPLPSLADPSRHMVNPTQGTTTEVPIEGTGGTGTYISLKILTKAAAHTSVQQCNKTLLPTLAKPQNLLQC